MSEDERLKITGKGFSSDDLTPEERAEFRELKYRMVRDFMTAEAFLADTGLAWLSKLSRGFPSFLKGFSILSTIGAGILAAKAMGIL